MVKTYLHITIQTINDWALMIDKNDENNFLDYLEVSKEKYLTVVLFLLSVLAQFCRCSSKFVILFCNSKQIIDTNYQCITDILQIIAYWQISIQGCPNSI